MPEVPRIAQPGDIFILLIPTDEDLARLQAEQRKLQAQYGGELVEPIHITAERFSPESGQFSEACVATLRQNLKETKPFPLISDTLIQFFAPYWQSHVLRWRVQESPIWSDFRDRLEATLAEIRCPSHFTRRRHATCTVLKLDQEIELPSAPQQEALMPLFTVRELWISVLKNGGQFEITEKLELNSI